MLSTDRDLSENWRTRPLCVNYLLMHFVHQIAEVHAGGPDSFCSIAWALGTSSDGQREIVGVWPHSPEGALDWHAVFVEIAVRGVKRIRFALDADQMAARASFPDAEVIGVLVPQSDAPESLASQSTSTSRQIHGIGACRDTTRTGHASPEHRGDVCELPPRIRRMVLRSEEAAEPLRRGLRQAVLPYGPFESPGAAAAFVEARLENAERRERKRQLAAQYRAAVAAAARLQ